MQNRWMVGMLVVGVGLAGCTVRTEPAEEDSTEQDEASGGAPSTEPPSGGVGGEGGAAGGAGGEVGSGTSTCFCSIR